MQLKEVVKNLDVITIEGPQDIEAKGITCDSRKVKKDFIFAAIKGNNLDGHKFVKDALDKGAICIITDEALALQQYNNAKTKISVKDIRSAYAKLCSNFYGNPSGKLKVIGITGTNGKTTTAFLIQAILERFGYSCGRLTTIDYNTGTKTLAASNTTPDAGLLQELFSDMANKGINYCIMEASSHALHQGRTDSVKFHSAIFTNLTKEHLDYHHTMDEYFLCKKMLFDKIEKEDCAVINIDDIYGKRLTKLIKPRIITYGFNKDADIRAEKEKTGVWGSSLLLITPKGRIQINTSLIGRHNIYNILAAVGMALEEKSDLNVITEAIREFRSPPGRLESISNPSNDFSVYVDYAHTDDALKNALSCLVKLKKGKLITVFGCGGDRDKTKRPRMGKIAAEFSDFVIITSDNPRTEDPFDIIEQVKKGLPLDFKNYFAIEDRKEAIEKAISLAKKDDIVLIAGKGHETHQIYKDRSVPFDDREVARQALSYSQQ